MDELKGSYRDLIAWQKGLDLVDAIYDVAARLPDDERHVLSPQIRRAAISIPSNIAEGYGRMTTGAYVHHLRIANGSLKEMQTQLIIAGRRGYVDRPTALPAWGLSQEVGKVLNGLIRSLT
jgi:four helix bundle protein